MLSCFINVRATCCDSMAKFDLQAVNLPKWNYVEQCFIAVFVELCFYCCSFS